MSYTQNRKREKVRHKIYVSVKLVGTSHHVIELFNVLEYVQ